MTNMKQRIIITGAAKGIGKEIAQTFAMKGAMVMLADRDSAEGLKSVEHINSSGGNSWFFHCDISVYTDIVSMIAEAENRMGGIDVLVNNAGFGIWKSPYELGPEEWDAVLNTNLRGTFLCSREAALVMRKNGGGSIINIASTRAFMSEPNSEAYAASKGGIAALTHAMAASFAGDSIRVNCISPGWIETGDYARLRKADHEQHFSGRVGKPSDIAEACVFLAGNDFINAANIIIDGGMTRKMIYEP
jgi:NAD(P)-dependent dehydrogenase (short-subunit alcohol dehydrogenase family)